MTLHLNGKVSWFGGPDDMGVDPDEGLAFITEVEQQPSIFLPEQPPGTSGLARRLDPSTHYIACRWDYDETPAYMLLEEKARVRAPSTGKEFLAFPADWGPHEDTGRVADISPGLLAALGIITDEEVEVTFPAFPAALEVQMYQSVVISSGHGRYIRGASGVLEEVFEARRVVESVAKLLTKEKIKVKTFHDNTSKSQDKNLQTIVNFHNKQERDLDVSIHFNAYVETKEPMGTECLYVSQDALSERVSSAIASCGFIDRGAKKRTDLYFLNKTEQPAILIEVCFVDSEKDAEIYKKNYKAICAAIANTISGKGPSV